MEFLEALLAIVKAISTDGGEGILEILEVNLKEYAPFDAGEVIVLGQFGFERHSFSGSSFAEDDILSAARKSGAPLLIGDILDSEQFTLTRVAMRKLGLRSVLILPFCSALVGWIALAREAPWSFSGVRFRILDPLARMTGLALEKARALSQHHSQAMVSEAPGEREPVEEKSSERVPDRDVRETTAPLSEPPISTSAVDLTTPLGSERAAPEVTPEVRQVDPPPVLTEPAAPAEAAGPTSDSPSETTEGAPRMVPLTRAERRARRRAQVVGDEGGKEF
jgi:hypothetical protein